MGVTQAIIPLVLGELFRGSVESLWSLMEGLATPIGHSKSIHDASHAELCAVLGE
jgi:hypothetical protein